MTRSHLGGILHLLYVLKILTELKEALAVSALHKFNPVFSFN